MRKLPPTLYFQPRSRPFVWLLARSWTTQEYGLFCSLSTTYFNPQSTKRHTIFQGWRQTIVQRLQLLFPLWRERRMGRGIVAGDKEKLCLFSNSSLSYHPSPPAPAPLWNKRSRGQYSTMQEKNTQVEIQWFIGWGKLRGNSKFLSQILTDACKEYENVRETPIFRYSKGKQHFSSLKE